MTRKKRRRSACPPLAGACTDGAEGNHDGDNGFKKHDGEGASRLDLLERPTWRECEGAVTGGDEEECIRRDQED